MNSSTKLIANVMNYIFCVSIQRITQSVPNFTTSWYLALEIYDGNINNIQTITIYWCFYHIISESIANILKWIHTHLLLFSTEWCFLQHQSVLRASGNHFINKNSYFVFSEIRFVLVLNLNFFHRHLVSTVKVLH